MKAKMANGEALGFDMVKLDNYWDVAQAELKYDPAVTITSPIQNARTGAAFTVTAEVAQPVSRVEFYLNSRKVGQATSAPYTYAASGLAPGAYTLFAIAFTADRKHTSSNPVTIDVHADGVIPDASATWSGTHFAESAANDGSIGTVHTVTLAGETFTGVDGDDFVIAGKVVVSNLPAGLTAIVQRRSATQSTVRLAGNASLHANANDVSNVSVMFADSAVTGGAASAVSGLSVADRHIDFADPVDGGPDLGGDDGAPQSGGAGAGPDGKGGCGFGVGLAVLVGAMSRVFFRSKR